MTFYLTIYSLPTSTTHSLPQAVYSEALERLKGEGGGGVVGGWEGFGALGASNGYTIACRVYVPGYSGILGVY